MLNNLSETTTPISEIKQVEPKKPNRQIDLLVLVLLFAVFAIAFVYFSFKKEDVGDQSRILWKFQVGKITKPILAGNTVYFAISTEDGKPLWSFDGKERPSRSPPFIQTSPVVVDGNVYFGGSQNFYALNATTGNEVWRYKLNPVPQSDGTADKGLVQDP